MQQLTPGRTYAAKLIAADLTTLGERGPAGVTVTIDGAEVLPAYLIAYVYPSLYNHDVPPYSKDHPAYFTFHRVVFRATGTTATLALSDWTPDGQPGGPTGHTHALNFVEVEPYDLP